MDAAGNFSNKVSTFAWYATFSTSWNVSFAIFGKGTVFGLANH
jgi:hypothetical protein